MTKPREAAWTKTAVGPLAFAVVLLRLRPTAFLGGLGEVTTAFAIDDFVVINIADLLGGVPRLVAPYATVVFWEGTSIHPALGAFIELPTLMLLHMALNVHLLSAPSSAGGTLETAQLLLVDGKVAKSEV